MWIAKGSVIVYKLFPLTSTSIQIQMVLGEFSAIEKRLPFLLAVVHPCTTPGSDAGHISIAWLGIWMFHHVITMWMLNSQGWCSPFLWDINIMLSLNSNIISMFHPFPICWKFSPQTYQEKRNSLQRPLLRVPSNFLMKSLKWNLRILFLFFVATLWVEKLQYF